MWDMHIHTVHTYLFTKPLCQLVCFNCIFTHLHDLLTILIVSGNADITLAQILLFSYFNKKVSYWMESMEAFLKCVTESLKLRKIYILSRIIKRDDK
ncbi:hypothetical protein CULT_2230004 [[Clostridium] ultunense Esp]|nr:hypothetical protein CULT_2230004 [[Clostridium] ultunense Esp]